MIFHSRVAPGAKSRAVEPSCDAIALRVGDLLVGAGFISEQDLQSGLTRQQSDRRKLGKLIVELGTLDESDLDAVLAIQRDLKQDRAAELVAAAGSRLAAILLASNVLTRAQLEHARIRAHDTDDQLGEVLVREGALSRAQLEGALAFQRQLHARRSDRYKLGKMMVLSGDISEQTLRVAVERQRITGKRFGETLLELGVITKTALGEALARQRRLIGAAIAAIAFLTGGMAPANAIAATTKLQVSARIASYVSFRSVTIPAQIELTPSDVARGYVDLDAPIEMAIKTNTSTGLLIGVSLNSPSFTGATVSGPSGSTRITPGAPMIHVASQGQGMRTESISLRVRIDLTRDAYPGVIPIPVSLLLAPA